MTSEFSGGRSNQYVPTITFVEESPPRIQRIALNTADLSDLELLPGVGPATAKRIIAARGERRFLHVNDLVRAGVVSSRVVDQIRNMVRARSDPDEPYIYDVATRPEHVLYENPFQLTVAFDESASGVRLIRLQVDSVSHSIDLTREINDERKEGHLTFDMPAMAAGVMNVQVTLYDREGHKDYLAKTLHIYHNPPFVIFYPSQKSLRLSNGAAQMKADGNFHCDSNFYFYNGTDSTVRLNRNMTWRIFSQAGNLLESGSWDWGSNITLGPWAVSTGWWFNFTIPSNNVTGNRLRAKEWIRTEWQFTQVGTGAIVSDDLTWRAVLGPHVNIIRVGEENFSSTERTRIFNALRNTAGSIYQQQDMDIGTIRTFFITVAQAGSYVTINSNGEAEDLTEDWTVDNDAIDMFVVRNFVGSTAGLSPVDGPCDKDAKGMNGNVIELQSSQALLGVIIAHEIGHYLGLGHSGATSNFMGATASSINTAMTSAQGNTMKSHCFIKFLA